MTASEKDVARLQDELAVLDESLAGASGGSLTDLLRDRARVAAALEEAELRWLDAHEGSR